jgi:hypothetical protein
MALAAVFAAAAAAQDGFPGGPALDAAIAQAIARDELPGAVLVAGYKGRIVHRKAYGWRARAPGREPMTVTRSSTSRLSPRSWPPRQRS